MGAECGLGRVNPVALGRNRRVLVPRQVCARLCVLLVVRGFCFDSLVSRQEGTSWARYRLALVREGKQTTSDADRGMPGADTTHTRRGRRHGTGLFCPLVQTAFVSYITPQEKQKQPAAQQRAEIQKSRNPETRRVLVRYVPVFRVYHVHGSVQVVLLAHSRLTQGRQFSAPWPTAMTQQLYSFLGYTPPPTIYIDYARFALYRLV